MELFSQKLNLYFKAHSPEAKEHLKSLILLSNVFVNINTQTYINFIYLFGVLCHFQHYTGHIMMGSWKGRGNQYIQLVKVVYCKLPTNGKQLPTLPRLEL